MTTSRFSSEAGPGAASPGLASQLVLAVLLGAATMAAARLGTGALLIVVAAVAGVGAVELGTDFGEQRLAASPLLYLVGVVAFPVAAYFWKEPGVTGAAAAVILLAAFRFVLSRPERGAVLSIAAFVLAALYLGFGASFVILLDRQGRGASLVVGLLLIAALFHIGRLVGDRVGRRSLAPHLPAAPTPLGVAAGVVGCLIGAVGFLRLAGHHIQAFPVLQIGLTTGAALTLGAVAWALIRPDRPPVERSAVPGEILGIVAGVVMAAPVLFYAVRLSVG